VQLVLQAVAPQTKGVQPSVIATGQLPPLQAVAAACVPAVQEAGRHWVAG